MSILGPNTFGFVSPHSGASLFAGGLDAYPSDGPSALVFQSSGLLSRALNLSGTRRLGVAHAVSLGNEAGIDAVDVLQYLAECAEVQFVGLLLEAVQRPRSMLRVLHSLRQAGKRVVAVKLGDSQAAQANAIAHAGKLATSGDGWRAAFAELGVMVASDVDELVIMLSLLEAGLRPGSGGIGALSLSGGDCSLLADRAEAAGLVLASIDPAALTAMRELTGKATLVGNPLDCDSTLRSDRARLRSTLELMLGQGGMQALLARLSIPGPGATIEGSDFDVVTTVAQEHGVVTVGLAPPGSRPAPPEIYEWFRSRGGLLLPDSYAAAFRCVAAVLGAGTPEYDVGSERDMKLDSVPDVMPLPGSTSRTSVMVPWSDSVAWLGKHSIPYAPYVVARTDSELDSAHDRFGGNAVVKAIVDVDLAHKNDVGAVVICQPGGLTIPEAARSIRHSLAQRLPQARVIGYEVQELLRRQAEVLVAMLDDTALGPIITIGPGGLLAELYDETLIIVDAFDYAHVRRSLSDLKYLRLLRQRALLDEADFDALAKFVVQFMRAVSATPEEFDAVELNPVMVGSGRVDAVDVLITRPSTRRANRSH